MSFFRLELAALTLLAATLAPAQTPPTPRAYPGVQIHVPGIFVTPVPNAPFTAKVDIISHEILPDGSINIRTTINHVARSSSGRIYNERRQLVPATFKGEPMLLSGHIYDPSSRLNIFYDPITHLARETVLPQPPRPPADAVPGRTPPNNPYFKQEDIGTQPLGNLTLTGIRKTRILPAQASTTGKDIVITDEYWYSPDLSIYMIIKHNDPRTGEQIVAVSDVDRHEPDASLLNVPQHYKVVDETPDPTQ
ncbi:MAG TPA: hypothetical protein VIX90_01345 [Edaphobacter sp.]